MYKKLAHKFQTQLLKLTNTLTQESLALGNRNDLLETKHDELSLAYIDAGKTMRLSLRTFYSYKLIWRI